MDEASWLLRNPRLIPGAFCFYLGAVLIILGGVLFQIRTKRLILIPAFVSWDAYNSREKRLCTPGVYDTKIRKNWVTLSHW
jgi:hypothetical protein